MPYIKCDDCGDPATVKNQCGACAYFYARIDETVHRMDHWLPEELQRVREHYDREMKHHLTKLRPSPSYGKILFDYMEGHGGGRRVIFKAKAS